MTGFLSKEQLLAERPATTLDVDIPGVGEVRVRALRASEREDLDSAANKNEKPDYRLYRARAVALALIDEDGEPFFQNPMKEASQLAQRLSAMELDVLFNAVDSISALTKRTQESLGKGSPTTTSTDS